ncbi:hypothetical protein J437_LFUL006295, partial [Ladona fulva]
MDNFFSSPDLFDDLKTRNIFCYETVRPNRKGMPKNIEGKRKLKRGVLRRKLPKLLKESMSPKLARRFNRYRSTLGLPYTSTFYKGKDEIIQTVDFAMNPCAEVSDFLHNQTIFTLITKAGGQRTFSIGLIEGVRSSAVSLVRTDDISAASFNLCPATKCATTALAADALDIPAPLRLAITDSGSIRPPGDTSFA